MARILPRISKVVMSHIVLYMLLHCNTLRINLYVFFMYIRLYDLYHIVTLPFPFGKKVSV